MKPTKNKNILQCRPSLSCFLHHMRLQISIFKKIVFSHPQIAPILGVLRVFFIVFRVFFYFCHSFYYLPVTSLKPRLPVSKNSILVSFKNFQLFIQQFFHYFFIYLFNWDVFGNLFTCSFIRIPSLPIARTSRVAV